MDMDSEGRVIPPNLAMEIRNLRFNEFGKAGVLVGMKGTRKVSGINVDPPVVPTVGNISITTTIDGSPSDYTIFQATLTGQGVDPDIIGPFNISQGATVRIYNLKFDEYVLTVAEKEGYNLIPMTGSVVLDADHLTGIFEVVNEVVSVNEPNIAVRNGALYNKEAVNDIRNICSNGWKVPSYSNFTSLFDYVGVNSAYKLRETGTDSWLNPSGTNAFGFNARGSGGRFVELLEESTSEFYYIKWLALFITTDAGVRFDYNSGEPSGYPPTIEGMSLRIIKESTTLTNGQTGIYTGNDGKTYRTICINGVEWLADNLCETKFRTGEDIPYVTDNLQWFQMTTPGYCWYGNNIGNGFITV